MCGIAGIILDDNVSMSRINIDRCLSAMLFMLRSRGPEASKTHRIMNGRGILGHTRLRVSDPSSEADQPFLTKAEKGVLVFNGEI